MLCANVCKRLATRLSSGETKSILDSKNEEAKLQFSSSQSHTKPKLEPTSLDSFYERRGRKLSLNPDNFNSHFSNQIPMSKYSIRPKYHHSCGSIKRDQNIARDWEHVEDNFTSLGGELSHWASDNSLQVTSGAIPIGETWNISC